VDWLVGEDTPTASAIKARADDHAIRDPTATLRVGVAAVVESLHSFAGT